MIWAEHIRIVISRSMLDLLDFRNQTESEAKKSMREQSLVGTQQGYPKRENLAENLKKNGHSAYRNLAIGIKEIKYRFQFCS